jgi:hypothetical protein
MRFQEIQEACWTGYQQQGMKKKGNRQVPNCVPVEEVKTGPEITGRDLLFKAAAMAMLAASQEGQSLDYEQAIRQASKIYGIPYQPSELPRLLAQRAEIDRQLALLKQGKQVARARRKEKLAPTPAGTDEYWKTHALPTDRIKPATKSLEEAMDTFLDNTARELLGLVIIAGGAFAVGTYYTILNKLKKYQGRQIIDALEQKGVTMNRQTYEQVKPLLNQFRQALKDNDGEQAKMLAKRIEQMIVIGKLSAPEPQAQDATLAAKERELAEDLKKWFKEKWVRFGPDGKIRGDCARGSNSEGKPKCLPQSKAQALGKKGRASAAAKKRREDPNPERRGPAKNVATKVKENAQGESEQQHGWRAELVDEISPITFEVRLTNRRSGESANFVVRPADLIRKGLAGKFSIDSMDIQDLQTGATRSIVTDDPAPWVYILDAVDALFHDTPALQARLEAQLKAHQDKNLPMLPGLKKREHAGQGIAVKDFFAGQDAIDRAQGKKDLDEKQDACYNKVKSRYKVWPSAYASGALVQCRKKGAANWGNKSKK